MTPPAEDHPVFETAHAGTHRRAGLNFTSPAERLTPLAAPPPGVRPSTPDEAFAALLAGNTRFVSSAPHYPNHQTPRRHTLATGQAPFATIFGCADSRVPPELVFDRGLGDLFIVRNAGHVPDPVALGSIEYGIVHAGTPLLVVLGHEACGAVGAGMAAHDNGEAPHGFIGDLVREIVPNVARECRDGGDYLRCVADHAQATARRVVEISPVVNEYVSAGRLAVVAARYHLATGRVEVLETVGPLAAMPAA